LHELSTACKGASRAYGARTTGHCWGKGIPVSMSSAFVYKSDLMVFLAQTLWILNRTERERNLDRTGRELGQKTWTDLKQQENLQSWTDIFY